MAAGMFGIDVWCQYDQPLGLCEHDQGAYRLKPLK